VLPNKLAISLEGRDLLMGEKKCIGEFGTRKKKKFRIENLTFGEDLLFDAIVT